MRSDRGEVVAVVPLPGWRCHTCRALLLRGTFGSGTRLEIQCRRCHVLNVFEASTDDATSHATSSGTAACRIK